VVSSHSTFSHNLLLALYTAYISRQMPAFESGKEVRTSLFHPNISMQKYSEIPVEVRHEFL